MNIAFIDHSYHQKTRSTDFFVRELLAGHEVDRFWDNSWETRRPFDIGPLMGKGYDLFIVWQLPEAAQRLLKQAGANVVFVPMWDGADTYSDADWRSLAGARILSFCHELHRTVTHLGLNSLYAQYWPDPAPFEPVEDFSTLRGFFWQRLPEIGWKEIGRLVEGRGFERFHIHKAADPGETVESIAFEGTLTQSDWFEDPAEMQAVLARHNIYFAPRTREGIGFSFIEAMGRGMVVVAADQPTMNEYITDGVDGLLWTLGDPKPLDFSNAARIGREARQAAIAGRKRWLAQQGAVQRFVFGEAVAPAAGAAASEIARPQQAPADRKVSVAVVTFNAAASIEATLASIRAQTWPGVEIVVVDGASTDGTRDILEHHRGEIATVVSEPDDGPYFAMNKAARLATGDYVIFINAGDLFASETALADAMESIPAGETPDFVIGHHLYRGEQGDILRRAADFDLTFARLKEGTIDTRWLAGVPCHQATLTRRALLAAEGYDTRWRIVADHAFLYREREKGARVHHSGALIAIYSAGGLSWTRRSETYEEWKTLLAEHGPAEAAERLHAEMRGYLEREALGRPSFQGIRSRNFVTKWQRSLRMRRDMILVQRTGLFFPNWYAEQNPEAKTIRGGPLRHYVRHGVYEYRDPSPFFDTRYYLLTHADARKSDMLPLLFYAKHGAARGDATTPWFAALWAEIAASAPSGSTPLARMIAWFAKTPAEDMLATCRRVGLDLGDAEWIGNR